MAKQSFTYKGKEAIEMTKMAYPNSWQLELKARQQKIIELSNRHKKSVVEVYKKFIMACSQPGESILYFAALTQIIELSRLVPKEKTQKVNELETKRENVKNQIVALELSETISYEDKKRIRAYYNKLQQETTEEINQLINSFNVIEPELIIYQQNLFQ